MSTPPVAVVRATREILDLRSFARSARWKTQVILRRDYPIAQQKAQFYSGKIKLTKSYGAGVTGEIDDLCRQRRHFL
jgi:hypothetical protein